MKINIVLPTRILQRLIPVPAVYSISIMIDSVVGSKSHEVRDPDAPRSSANPNRGNLVGLDSTTYGAPRISQ